MFLNPVPQRRLHRLYRLSAHARISRVRLGDERKAQLPLLHHAAEVSRRQNRIAAGEAAHGEYGFAGGENDRGRLLRTWRREQKALALIVRGEKCQQSWIGPVIGTAAAPREI